MTTRPDNHCEFVRPSELERVATCPASWQRGRAVKDEAGPEAESGKQIHLALKNGSVAGLDDSQKDNYAMCAGMLNYIMSRWSDEEKKELIIEKEITIEWEGWGGTADVLIVDHDAEEITIVDYKTGRVPVAPAERNFQMAAYAWLAHMNYHYHTVHAVVVQPLVSGLVDRATFYGDDDYWRAIGSSIKRVIDLAMVPEPYVHPTAKACTYCRASPVCPECIRMIDGLIELPDVEPEEVPLEDLAELIDRADDMKRALKIIKRAEDRLKAEPVGTQAGQWMVKEHKGNRKAIDIVSIAEILDGRYIELYGDLAAVSKVTITNVELKKFMKKFCFDFDRYADQIAPRQPSTKTLEKVKQ